MKIKYLLVGILSCMLLVGCGSKEDDNRATQVRVGLFPNITHSQGLISKAEGTLQENLGEDYNVTWTTFNAGPAEIEALFAGQIDIGYMGPVPAINGYVKSHGDLQIIAGATNGGSVLVSKKDEVFKSVTELDKKKVAIPQFGNTQHLSLLHLLKENNLSPTTDGGTVEIVQAANTDIKTLLDRGEIDAALVPEPWGTRLISEVGANIVSDYQDIWLDGNYSTALVVVNKDFLKEHPNAVKKFLETHVEATEYINTNTEEAIHTINSEIENITGSRLSEDVIMTAFDRLIVTYEPASSSIMQFIDLSLEADLIDDCKDAQSLINLEILNEVLTSKNLQPIQ